VHNKDGCVHSRRRAPQIGYINSLPTSLERAVAIYNPNPNHNPIPKPINCSIAAKSLANISPGTPVKRTQMCVFLPMCTHPPTHPQQTRHRISDVTGPTFKKFFIRRRGVTGGIKAIIDVATVVECQRKERRRCVDFRRQVPQIGYHGNVP